MRASCARGAVVAVVVAAAGVIATPALAEPLDDVRRGATVVRRGDAGPAVEALQRALVAAGLRVAVDGVFGGETEGAVRAFQTREGCAIDGVVGRETMTALDRALGAGVATWPSGAATPSIPPRPAGARGGAAVMTAAAPLSRAAREDALLREVRAGNVPDFLRRFVAVTASRDGRTLVYQVAPDYLCVGHDRDFVRVPLSADAAQAAADALGCLLPTPRMVDQVFAQAAVRLAPRPLPPGAAMVTVPYFVRHHEVIEGQRAGHPPGALTAGHKKDVVLTNRLVARPAQVAIYGWHRPDGRPIQPLSLVHERAYADYSHGVRLVHPDALLDGRPVRLADVLRDPALAPLVSAEGALRTLRAAP